MWAETLSTAAYLRNRSPTTRSVKGMTPFETLQWKKPDVGHLRVFGCAAYAHIPKDVRKKLDVKAKRCVLVGYSTEVKGCRVFDPLTRKLVYSRDVRFNEEQTGVEKGVCSAKLNIERCVELKLTSDDFFAVVDVEDSLEIGNSEPVRRSTRERRRPDYLAESVSFASAEKPGTYREAVSSPRWKQAMANEMKSLRKNEVWELVEPPLGRQVVGSKWVYKIK